jgi:dTDP-4-dehydrorhamnose reductase
VSEPIVITGAAGQLGQALVEAFAQERPVQGFTRTDLDVTDSREVLRVMADVRPSAIINCSAYNAVDRAEDEPKEAFAVNALAVANLARAAAEANVPFVHYSSDFVFDGETDRPYTEESATRPGGIYAASKLVGEWFARDAPQHYVLRVESLFGGVYKLRSSIDRIVDALESGQPASVFVDRIVSPSYVFDVAAATKHLLRNRAPCGLYHCVNSGAVTWEGLAQEIVRQLQLPSTLRPIRMADLQLRAPRPRFCALSNEKLRRAGFDMPTWQSALGRYLAPRVARKKAVNGRSQPPAKGGRVEST